MATIYVNLYISPLVWSILFDRPIVTVAIAATGQAIELCGVDLLALRSVLWKLLSSLRHSFRPEIVLHAQNTGTQFFRSTGHAHGATMDT